jgi:DNA-binding transcriptional regulator PaaX
MGQLEQESGRRARRRNISAFVLQSVAVAGLLGVAMVAPNVIGAMDKMGLIPGKRQKEIVNRARERLTRQGLLHEVDGFLRLTKRGETALRILVARDASRAPRKRWDKKWRILIFDIPNYRKGLRDKVRRTLESIGFTRLQDSVWIYPHDCEDLVALLKADFKIGKDMLYLIVEEIEGASRLKRHFDLH